MQDDNVLNQILQEFRLLREAVERIEQRLATVKIPSKRQSAELSETECKRIYREILDEYREQRTTRKLDALLLRSKADLSLFCSANNLPIELRNGKHTIRDQILARIREDEQLGASYPMPTQEPAYVAERKK